MLVYQRVVIQYDSEVQGSQELERIHNDSIWFWYDFNMIKLRREIMVIQLLELIHN